MQSVYPPPPRKRHRLRTWTLAIVGGLIAVAVIAAIASSGDKPARKTTPPVHAVSVAPTSAAPVTTPEVYSPPTPKYVVPTKRSIKITLKILTKECFGDAGCNVSYRPQLEQLTLGDFDPSITYDVTYEVRGVEDGPQIDTLQMTGSQYESSEGFAQTTSSGAKLTAVITSVEAE
jgi:hypothetical protein